MNQIIIMGRMVRDPELRHTPNGIPVASFTLAVDRGFIPKDGSERQTDFIDVVAWRNTGEFVARYFIKGQMAAVVGRLQIRNWEDKDGNKRRSAEVIASSIHFTESKKSRDAFAAETSLKTESAEAEISHGPSSTEFIEVELEDEDLPF